MLERKNNIFKGKKEVPKLYADMFKDNRNPAMGLKLKTTHTEGEIYEFKKEFEDNIDEAWGFCLLGFFSGPFPGRKLLHDLYNSWGVEYMYNFHHSGWMVFKFSTNEDRQKVLKGGPYSRMGRQIHLKTIPKYFGFDSNEMTIVPVWVKLHDWPFEFWNEKSLSEFSSMLGFPECTDGFTCMKRSISHARVLIHIDATKELKKEMLTKLPSGELRKIKI